MSDWGIHHDPVAVWRPGVGWVEHKRSDCPILVITQPTGYKVLAPKARTL